MKRLIYLLLAISLILFIFSTITYTYLQTPLKEGELNITINVTEKVAGFDVSKDKLSFGKVSINGIGTRSVNIKNDYPFPIYIESKVKGDVKNIIFFKKVERIEPYKNISLAITARPNENSKLGYQEGIFYYKIKRAL